MFLFITDILLVLTVFNKDINYRNMVVFFIILCTKSILWVSTIRMDHDINMKMVYCNIYTGVFSLIFCSIFFSKINILFLFTFEFGIIVLSSIKNICILLIKLRDTDTNKSLLIFYTDIIHLSSLLVLYIIFIVVTSIHYKVPLNVFRSSVSILEKLIKKIKSYTRYTKICKELERVPDVRDEGECPICTDNMEVSKKLRCGHIFHLECLKQWCERQPFCPICKADLCLSSQEEVFYQDDEILTGVEVDLAE
jgi:E3 ubiquitin-protein ligase synoviolin